MMTERRRERLISWMSEAASEFIARSVALPGTLITVTRVLVAPNLERATIYFSVWPESRETEVLKAVRAVRRDFYEYAERKFTMGQRIPVDFALDHGEKARRKFEEILRGVKPKGSP
ncbi:MAG: hypothetical protein HYT22_03975 [Candidatus Niyogibacteria bacterium]|nr:hypothetical protein [Candidatus Niyogibacteria bacterium]